MPRFSRRSFLHLSAAATAAASFRFMNEPMLAAASRREPHSPDAVMIDSNENPLGPSQSAATPWLASSRRADATPTISRTIWCNTFAQMEGLDPAYVSATVGSTPPLRTQCSGLYQPAKNLRHRRSRLRARHDDRREQWRSRGKGSR